MLDVGRRAAQGRAASPGPGGTLQFVVGDAESPPPGLGTFDVVVSRHVLCTLPRPERAIAERAALLHPLAA